MIKNLNPTREMMEAYYEAENKAKEEKNVVKAKRTLNPLNYLNNSFDMENGKYVKKVIRFRGVPIDNETPVPFVKIKTHLVRKGGKNSYVICLKHTKGISHLGLGEECPFCELQERFQSEARTASSEAIRKQYFEEANKNRSMDMYIMKGLERETWVYAPNAVKPEKIEKNELKFWRFSSPKKNDGFFDIIRDLDIEQAQESIENDEQDFSIFDLYNGKDLKITSKAKKGDDGRDTFEVSKTIKLAKERNALSDNPENIQKWINSDIKWYDVFTPKEYGVMRILAFGATPMFDIETKTWTKKEEFEAIKATGKTPKFDVEEDKWIDEDTFNAKHGKISETKTIENIEKQYSKPTITDKEEDLPF